MYFYSVSYFFRELREEREEAAGLRDEAVEPLRREEPELLLELEELLDLFDYGTPLWGTLLGTGGLVHAYGDSAKAVLARCETEPLVEKTAFFLTADYALYEPLRRLWQGFHTAVIHEEFGTAVQVQYTPDYESFYGVSRVVVEE